MTGINRLWVADITYIRLEEEFLYMAVILDALSRRVIGRSLDDTMAELLTRASLQMALSEREASRGLHGSLSCRPSRRVPDSIGYSTGTIHWLSSLTQMFRKLIGSLRSPCACSFIGAESYFL